jgi:O-antigen ligase
MLEAIKPFLIARPMQFTHTSPYHGADLPLRLRRSSPTQHLFARLSSWLTLLYATLTLALFLSVADQALGHAKQLPLNATLLCLVLLAPFTLSGLINRDRARSEPDLIGLIAANTWVLGAFLILVLIALISASSTTAYWGEGGKWIAIIPYGFAVMCSGLALGLNQVVVRALPIICCLSLALLVGSIWYDTLHPGTFADARNRAAGFPGNANFAALVSVIVCAVGLDFSQRRRNMSNPARHAIDKVGSSATMNLLLLLLTFAIVTMTMSRGGLVNFFALLAVFTAYRYLFSPISTRRKILEIIALTLCVIAAVGFVVIYSELSSQQNNNSRLSRLLSNQRVDDGSAGTRLAAVMDCVEHIERSPLVGYGTGYARTMNELPHNIYLQQWVNNGLFGLVAYLALLLTALITFHKRGYRNGVALIVVVGIGGLFSHNLLDQRPFLILFGTLLADSTVAQLTGGTSMSLLQLRTAPKQRAAHQS